MILDSNHVKLKGVLAKLHKLVCMACHSEVKIRFWISENFIKLSLFLKFLHYHTL